MPVKQPGTPADGWRVGVGGEGGKDGSPGDALAGDHLLACGAEGARVDRREVPHERPQLRRRRQRLRRARGYGLRRKGEMGGRPLRGSGGDGRVRW